MNGPDDALDDDLADLRDLQDRWGAEGQAQELDEPSNYVSKVLGVELRQLERRATATSSEHDVGGTLALLTGMSRAPLLLAIAWRRPERIVLFGSDTDSGREAVSAMERAIAGPLQDQLMLRPLALEPEYVHDRDPARAYASIRARIEALRREQPNSRLIIDITGGKKSMVAAAFVAASEAEIPAQYVDFDDYDPATRMPRLGTAFIHTLPDPAAVLRIRETRLAERAFDDERYDECVRLLTEIEPHLNAARLGGFASESEAEALRLRLSYARAARLWQQLALDEAERAFAGPLRRWAPRIVLALGPMWRATAATPELRNGRRAKIAEDLPRLASYAGDELWRHRRALSRGDDPRFPFLRTYALVELVLSVVIKKCRAGVRIDGKPLPNDLRSASAIGRELSMPGMAALVSGEEISLGYPTKQSICFEGEKIGIPAAAALTQPEEWPALRNECAHGAAEVARSKALEFVGTMDDPGLAGKVLREAFAFLVKDFKGEPVNLEMADVYRPARWEELAP